MIKASIIIRTFNEGKHLARLLETVQTQSFKDWEIIIVDSGSVDNTLEIAESYSAKIIKISPEDFSFGRSLNVGCKAASGEYLIFVSGHTYPANGMWLYNLLKPFEDPKIGMVYGRQVGNHLTKIPEERDLRNNFGDKSKILVEESFGNNANAAIRRSLWEHVPFDENLPGLEDIDWAKKTQKRGLYVYYKSDAVIHHVHTESYRQIYNRFKREAIAYKMIFPSIHYSSSRTLLTYVKIAVKDILYGLKRRMSLSKLFSSLLYRVAEFKGWHDGYRHVGSMSQDMMNELYFPKRNRSVVISGVDQHQIEEGDIPALGDGDLLINVKYVGVCTTDLEILSGELGYYKSNWAKYPIVPGHEFSGVVARAGKNAGQFRVGDKVVGECILGCGACEPCQNDNPISCAERKEVGVLNFQGAYSHYLKMPARVVHKLPLEAKLDQACLIEPLAVSVRGVRRLSEGVDSGVKNVAVLGFGTIGNLCAQLLILKGHKVTVFDKNKLKLNVSKDLGIEARTEISGLAGFDYIIEATGSTEVLKKALNQSKTSAKILLLGLPYSEMEFDFSSIVSFDKIVVGSVGSSARDFEEAIKLYPKLNLSALTQYIFAFDDYQTAWEKQKNGEVVKAIIKVDKV